MTDSGSKEQDDREFVVTTHRPRSSPPPSNTQGQSPRDSPIPSKLVPKKSKNSNPLSPILTKHRAVKLHVIILTLWEENQMPKTLGGKPI